jgi:hypothetical protein
LGELLEKLDREEVELVATIARKIWLHRNIVIFGREFTHPSQVIQSAKKLWKDFNAPAQKVQINEQDQNTEVPKWMVPPCGVIKVN